MSDPAQNYDPRRFETTVPYYACYRLAYPDLLIQRVIERVGLKPGDAVMDLGCGPGPLAIPFAKAGMAVVGVDPEPDMLAVAEAAAHDADVAIDFRRGSSFEMPAGIGPFKLVTMGRAFHWMDRDGTLATLDKMIAPGGAIALLHDHNPKSRENAWHNTLHEVANKYGRHGSFHVIARTRGDHRAHESVLMDSAFAHVEKVSVYLRAPRTVDDIVGLAFSMSTTAPQRLGANKDAFERDLRTKLAELSPDGQFEDLAEMTAIIATRP